MTLRALTPLGWTAAVLIGLGVVAAGAGLGLRWDPLNLVGRRLEAAQAQAAHARADADARRLEQAAETGQRRRLAALHDQAAAVESVTAAAITQARLSHAADQPLDDDSAARLRAHDRELCRLAPDLGGCAAPAGTAAPGGPAL